MNLFIKICFVFSFYVSHIVCGEAETTTVIDDDIVSKENIWAENLFLLLEKEKTAVVLVELSESLLLRLRSTLGKGNDNLPQIKSTVLATFDSTGLQNVSVYNDTSKIRQVLKDLRPPIGHNNVHPPTFGVLKELFQRDLPEGSVLLVTESLPGENSLQDIITFFPEKKRRLSVLWGGNYQSFKDSPLEFMVLATGGEFGWLEINFENLDENYKTSAEHYRSLGLDNLSEEIKFPEVKESTTEGILLVSKAANQKTIQKAFIPLIVEVASGSSLEARPGTPTQIQFTVKNNLNMVLPVGFSAKLNGVVQTVQPFQTFIPPSATTTVTVHLQIIGPETANAVRTLTLAARSGSLITARSALIYTTPQTTTDNNAPKINHKYEGDCSNYKEPQNCEQGQWSLEATIQDEESGLLKVLSEPYGLLFQSHFTAGSKTAVKVYYTATCCQPNVIIWAEDLKGNYIKRSYDVFNQNLLAGEIASIVIGVLLVLFIITAIIVAIILIKRRNQRKLVIPRSGSR